MALVHLGCSVLGWIKQLEALGHSEVLTFVDQVLFGLLQVILELVQLFQCADQMVFVESLHVGNSAPPYLVEVVNLLLTFKEVVFLLVAHLAVTAFLRFGT